MKENRRKIKQPKLVDDSRLKTENNRKTDCKKMEGKNKE